MSHDIHDDQDTLALVVEFDDDARTGRARLSWAVDGG